MDQFYALSGVLLELLEGNVVVATITDKTFKMDTILHNFYQIMQQ